MSHLQNELPGTRGWDRTVVRGENGASEAPKPRPRPQPGASGLLGEKSGLAKAGEIAERICHVESQLDHLGRSETG
jgi:hypothetical protein